VRSACQKRDFDYSHQSILHGGNQTPSKEVIMLKPDKDGSIRLTVSPFLKVVLVVIAAALCLIALRGFLAPSALYAQSGSEMDVNIKSVGGWSIYGALPIEIKSATTLPVEIKNEIQLSD